MIVPEVSQDPGRLLASAAWSQCQRGKQTNKEVFGENKQTNYSQTRDRRINLPCGISFEFLKAWMIYVLKTAQGRFIQCKELTIGSFSYMNGTVDAFGTNEAFNRRV